jgi:hypothetical protein
MTNTTNAFKAIAETAHADSPAEAVAETARADSPARPTRRRKRRRVKRIALKRGSRVVWPAGVQEFYGISSVTRWRWEREGKLPPRDVHIGGRSGWRFETLASAEQQQSS